MKGKTMSKCHACKTGFVTADNVAVDGPDAICDKCVDRKHVQFMQRMARRGVKMSCVKGCKCGFGG